MNNFKDEMSNGKEFTDKSGGKKNFKNRKFKRMRKVGGLNRGGKIFNDPSFYTKNPQIVKDFASLPFNYIPGATTLTKDSEVGPQIITQILSYVVDWVAQVKDDSLNYNQDKTDILNQVATILFTIDRKANSGAKNYEFPDLMISNLLAGIDIFVNLIYANRCFGIANTFNWKNRLIPVQLFEHMGIDYDDFISNLSNYRGRMNIISAKARTIKLLARFNFVPAIMSQFKEIYKDDDSDTGREQLMLALKGFHHIYDSKGTDENPGGMVRLLEYGDLPDYDTTLGAENHPVVTLPHINGGSKFTFKTLLDIIDAQINALISDEDFNMIQGDVEKAFGDQGEGYLETAPITGEGTITPVYSSEFNMMFENGRFMPLPEYNYVNPGSEMKYPGLGYLTNRGDYVNTIYQGHGETDGETYISGHLQLAKASDSVDSIVDGKLNIVNTDANQPTDVEVVIMTRFLSNYREATREETWYPDEISRPVYVPTAHSNFIVFGGFVTTVHASSENGFRIDMEPWFNTMDYAANYSLLDVFFGLLNFKTYPLMFKTNGGSSWRILKEVNNIKAIPTNDLEGIHQACFLSLWDLPDRATF